MGYRFIKKLISQISKSSRCSVFNPSPTCLIFTIYIADTKVVTWYFIMSSFLPHFHSSVVHCVCYHHHCHLPTCCLPFFFPISASFIDTIPTFFTAYLIGRVFLSSPMLSTNICSLKENQQLNVDEVVSNLMKRSFERTGVLRECSAVLLVRYHFTSFFQIFTARWLLVNRFNRHGTQACRCCLPEETVVCCGHFDLPLDSYRSMLIGAQW